MTVLLSLLLAAVPTVTLVAADEVRLSEREVRLGDVANVEVGELNAVIVARVPDNRTTVRLSRSEVASLIRRALPGVEVEGSSASMMTLVAPPRPTSAKVINDMKPAMAPAVTKGQRLTLASHAGPVTIERPVTALQAARPVDQRIFVRTDDGEIFAAPIKIDGDPAHE